MPGFPGNAATLAIGKQTAKGTPQTTPTFKQKFVSGDVMPAREMLTLAETDASIQDGATVVVGSRVEGTPEHYVRPDSFGLAAHAILGATATTGGGADKVHTATLVVSQPYFTLYKAINTTTLVDRYADCRATSMTVRGSAGGALTYSLGWAGLSALFNQTDPVLAAETQSPLVYPQITVTKGGAAPGTVQSFEVTITRNGAFVPGDIGLSQIDWVTGKVSVSGTMTILFENDDNYNQFHTGTSGGTAPTSTIFSEALNINAVVTSVLGVAFDFAAVEYTEYPVPINVDGSPIVVAAGFRSKPAAVVADYIEIITKNLIVSY